ncbi:hypothetical protein Tco_0349310 [Tanacetum coccineum]
MTEEEQLAADTKKEIKANKKANRIQQQSGSKSESDKSDEKDVNEDEVEWLSTDDEEKADDDEMQDDDKCIDIEEIDDEITKSDNDNQVMDDAEKNDADKLEEEKGDEEQTEEEQANDDQAQKDQAKYDIVGTLVTMSQKEKPGVPPSSSSLYLLSNYGNQFINVSSDTSLVGIIKEPLDTKINSLLDVQIQQEIPFVLSAPLLDVLVLVIPPHTTPTPTLTSITTNHKIESLVYDVIQKNPALVAQSFSTPTQPSSKVAESPSELELKRKGIDAEPSKKSSASKESSKGKTPPKTSKTSKSVIAKEPVEEHMLEMAMDVKEPTLNETVDDVNQPQADVDTDPKTDKSTYTPINFSTCAMNHLKIDKLTKADLENLEGERCPYDLSKPLPLKGRLGHLTIPMDHFFNNDLEFLRTVKVAYNKDAKLGITHWGPKCQLFYKAQINRLSKHDVFSIMRILSVVNVKVDKQFGYGYLEEIVVRRADQKLYTFKEGDFKNLPLNDIEDMLILHVKNKLSNLEGHDIIDLAIAL